MKMNNKCVQAFMYNYTFKPTTVEPFKKSSKFAGKRYWQWLADMNLNILPTSIMFTADVNRSFTKQLFRDVHFDGVNASQQRALPEIATTQLSNESPIRYQLQSHQIIAPQFQCN